MVTLLEKLPIPLSLVVRKSLMVGLGEVLQQTPRAVTVAVPSEVTLPPKVAKYPQYLRQAG